MKQLEESLLYFLLLRLSGLVPWGSLVQGVDRIWLTPLLPFLVMPILELYSVLHLMLKETGPEVHVTLGL